MNEEGINVRQALLIGQATDLARSGAYEEAEQALSEAKAADEEDPIVFDLLARIRAQQGRYNEAEVFWKEAARLDPGNEAYRAGLKRVRSIHSRPYLPTYWSPLLIGTLAVGMLAFMGVALWRATLGESASRPVVAEMPTPPSLPQLPAPVQAVHQPPHIEFTVPRGAKVSTKAGAILLKFEQGLFDSRTRLLPESEKLLKQVAQQLLSHKEGLRIEVEGHTNDLPVPPGSPFSDNVDLGLRRAVVVTNILRKAVSSSPHMFVVSSQGEANPPYENDGVENRARNRTVVVHVSKQGS